MNGRKLMLNGQKPSMSGRKLMSNGQKPIMSGRTQSLLSFFTKKAPFQALFKRFDESFQVLFYPQSVLV